MFPSRCSDHPATLAMLSVVDELQSITSRGTRLATLKVGVMSLLEKQLRRNLDHALNLPFMRHNDRV